MTEVCWSPKKAADSKFTPVHSSFKAGLQFTFYHSTLPKVNRTFTTIISTSILLIPNTARILKMEDSRGRVWWLVDFTVYLALTGLFPACLQICMFFIVTQQFCRASVGTHFPLTLTNHALCFIHKRGSNELNLGPDMQVKTRLVFSLGSHTEWPTLLYEETVVYTSSVHDSNIVT